MRPLAVLAACYEFEGTTTDGSDYGNHATSTEISFAPGRVGLAVTITDASDIIAPDSASLDIATAVTIEAWVNPTMLSTVERSVIVDHEDGYALFLRDGRLGATLLLDTGTSTFQADVVLGVDTGWAHVAVTFGSGTSRVPPSTCVPARAAAS